MGFPGGSAGTESACNVGDLGSIPGLRRSPGEGKGHPLQYSGLENSMDHGVAKSWTRLSDFHFTFQPPPFGNPLQAVPRNIIRYNCHECADEQHVSTRVHESRRRQQGNKAIIREVLTQFSQLLRNQADDSVFEPHKEQVSLYVCMYVEH